MTVDLAIFVAPVITALMTGIGVYVAMVSRITAMEVKFENFDRSISSQIGDLKKSVEKHNQVIERTFLLEKDRDTIYHRIDELREEQKDMQRELRNGIKIGGTDD